MKRPICWDSPAELNLLRLLECDASIDEVREQPFTIEYRLDGELLKHIPDFLVRTGIHKRLVEVKTKSDAAHSEVARRTALMAAECPRFGYSYSVAIAEDLRRQPRLRNVGTLLRHGRGTPTFEQRELCRRLAERGEVVVWGDIAAGLYPALTIGLASRMVIDGVFMLDLEQELAAQRVGFRQSLAAVVSRGDD